MQILIIQIQTDLEMTVRKAVSFFSHPLPDILFLNGLDTDPARIKKNYKILKVHCELLFCFKEYFPIRISFT